MRRLIIGLVSVALLGVMAGSPVSALTVKSKPSKTSISKISSKTNKVKNKVDITVSFQSSSTHVRAPLLSSQVKVGAALCNVSGKSTKCTLRNLSSGKVFKVSVRSRNKNGYGPWSNAVSYLAKNGSSWTSKLPNSSVPVPQTNYISKSLRDAVGVIWVDSGGVAPFGVRKSATSGRLLAVGKDSSFWDVLGGVSMKIERFLIAPSDKLYAFGYFSIGATQGNCRLIEISRDGQSPVCLESDPSVEFVEIEQVNSVLINDVQFDNLGNLYVLIRKLTPSNRSYSVGSGTSVRKYSGATKTDFGIGRWVDDCGIRCLNGMNLVDAVRNFLVNPDGTVVLDQEHDGQFEFDGHSFSRKFTLDVYRPNGSVVSMEGQAGWSGPRVNQLGSMWRGPNGQIFGNFSLIDLESLSFVEYLAPSSRLPLHTLESLGCSYPVQTPISGFISSFQRWICSEDRGYWGSFGLLGGERFAVLGLMPGSTGFDRSMFPSGIILRMFPSPALLSTSVVGVDAYLPVVGSVLIAGQDSDGRNKLVIYDAESRAEKVLISSDSGIRISSVRFAPAENQVWFEGTRLSDSQKVFGRVSANGGTITIVDMPAGTRSMQTFAR